MAQLTDSPITRARLAAWIVWVAQVLNIALILPHYYRSPRDPSLQLDLAIFTSGFLLHTLVTIGLYLSQAFGLRILLVFTTIFSLILEAILHDPFDKGILWWSVTISFILTSLILRPKEFRYGYFITGGVTVLAIGLIMASPYLPHYPQNAFNTDLTRLVIVTIGIGVGGSLVVQRANQLIMQQLSEREMKLTEMMEQQQKVIAELQQKKAEADAALRQLEELRQVEQRRAETERFLNQYEVLMRTGYQQSVEAFYQSLLDALGQEAPVMEAVLYRRGADNGWEVVATWGALDKKGKVIHSPLLESVASLQEVSWIPLSADYPSSLQISFPVLKPKGHLYLPFFHEAQQETVAIAELVLGAEIPQEQRERLNILLLRIGNYLGIRMQQMHLA